MGLDIHIGVDNDYDLFTPDYHNEENDYFHQHSLSREFCNFMCRRHVVEHDAELDQIGHITGVDISAFYDMENYPSDEGLEYSLEFSESEEERQEIISTAEADKAKLSGNIDKVLNTINLLSEKLASIEGLPNLLVPTNFDTLNNAIYFSDFTINKGEGYIGNNFGQDLRNFRCFLEYAQSKGTTTVWFEYS